MSEPVHTCLKREVPPEWFLFPFSPEFSSILFGYIHVFDRQVEALANKGDVAIGISTSGNSINVVNALKAASKLNCNTIGFSGQDGGEMNKICNINLSVPSEDTPRIQEMHILIGHTICHLIDQEFTG